MKYRLLICLFTSLMAGCGKPDPTPPVVAAPQTDPAELAILAAQTAENKAESAGGEWADVDALIKQAEAAAEQGDADKAIHLANQARELAELGYLQAEQEKHAGPWQF
jgi:hypothetical protein